MTLSPDEIAFISSAAKVLEQPNILIRLSNHLGHPLVRVAQRLPEKLRGGITQATQKALSFSLKAAIATIGKDSGERRFYHIDPPANARRWIHTVAAMSLGAGSGALGAWALAVELPLTTTIIMRSMAQMAQAEGFDIKDPEVELQILAVFAYGSPTSHDDEESQMSFYSQRAAMDLLIKQSAKYLVGKTTAQILASLDQGLAPLLAQFLGKIASRLNIVIGEKFLAQGIPILGAAGGAAINGMFSEHYSMTAHYVFGLKKLEERYGMDEIRSLYEAAC